MAAVKKPQGRGVHDLWSVTLVQTCLGQRQEERSHCHFHERVGHGARLVNDRLLDVPRLSRSTENAAPYPA